MTIAIGKIIVSSAVSNVVSMIFSAFGSSGGVNTNNLSIFLDCA